MNKNELKALIALSEGVENPNGMGPVMRHNFLSRGWMVRGEREYDFGPERYVITQAGITALSNESA